MSDNDGFAVALLVVILFLALMVGSQSAESKIEEFAVTWSQDDVVFEYGAESGVLQPPWDYIKGDGVTYGTVDISSTHVRTDSKSMYFYQKPPPKTNLERRAIAKMYGTTIQLSEGYLSWWQYMDSNCVDPANADDWGPTPGGWQLWFGPSGSKSYWWTGGRFSSCGGAGTSRRIQFGYRWGKVDGGTTFSSVAYAQQEYFDPAEDWCYYDNLKNKWVQFQVYWKLSEDSDGAIKAWINGNRIANKTGIITDPRGFSAWDSNPVDWGQTYFRSTCEGGYPHVGIELYQGTSSFENWMWADDIVIATEYVPSSYYVGYPWEPVPPPIPPTPPVDPTPPPPVEPTPPPPVDTPPPEPPVEPTPPSEPLELPITLPTMTGDSKLFSQVLRKLEEAKQPQFNDLLEGLHMERTLTFKELLSILAKKGGVA